MNEISQNMYQKHEDAKVEDHEIAALLTKVRGMFSAVRNTDWLEWGSDLMPEMRKILAEDEHQAEFEHRVRYQSEQLQLLKD